MFAIDDIGLFFGLRAIIVATDGSRFNGFSSYSPEGCFLYEPLFFLHWENV